MISHHGSRFIVYSIVSPVKIVLFLGSMVSAHYTDIYIRYLLYLLYLQCQVYFTTATGAVRSAADLTNLFYTSYHEHSYRVVEVIAQEISSATQEVDTSA